LRPRAGLMHFILSLLVLLTALAQCAQAQFVPHPAPMKCLEHSVLRPKADDRPPPPEGDRGYDVVSYDLDIRFDPSTRTVQGVNVIRLRPLAEGLYDVRFDLVDELLCTGILYRGEAIAFTHAGDSLVAHLPEAPIAQAPMSLEVSWEGRPPPYGPFRAGLMFRMQENDTLNDPDDDVPIIANMSQPSSSHSWWPCKDIPGDKALVSMAATVPDTLYAISNGLLLTREDVEPGWKRFSYRSEYPIAPYLVSIAATNYENSSEYCRVDGMPAILLHYHIFPQLVDEAFHDLANTCAMMEFMQGMVGVYPFYLEKYAQAEFKWLGSMEHQTATSLSQVIFTGNRYHEGVVIHEIAHQWFGDSLTPEVWADIWLNEGFARYFEALWIEHTEGVEAYKDYMRLIGPERHPNLFAGEGTLADPAPILPNSLIYDKGAWVLHMLRMHMGDGDFFDFLYQYATDRRLAYGQVTLTDMEAHAELAAGEDLSAFFDPWVQTATVPAVTSTVDLGLEGEIAVTLKQSQVPLFDLTIPVVTYCGGGSTTTLVRLNGREVNEKWVVNCLVDSVKIDPEQMVLMRRFGDTPMPLEVKGPWPNPVSGGAGNFEVYLISGAQVSAKLYDMSGSLLADIPVGQLDSTGPSSDPTTVPHPWVFTSDMAGSRRQAAGVYWLEFTASTGGRDVRKLTLLH
jgi:aminopeptidase N